MQGGTSLGQNLPGHIPGPANGLKAVISPNTRSIMEKVGVKLKDGILTIPPTENVSGLESPIDFKTKGVQEIHIGSYITSSSDAGYISLYTKDDLGNCEEYVYLYMGSTITGCSHNTITQPELKDRLIGHGLYTVSLHHDARKQEILEILQ